MLCVCYYYYYQNGLEATRRIRELGFKRLIIGVTGDALDEDKRAFLDSGADAVLAKPLRQAQITAIFEHTAKHGFKSHAGRKLAASGGAVGGTAAAAGGSAAGGGAVADVTLMRK